MEERCAIRKQVDKRLKWFGGIYNRFGE